jgi:beta-lactamase class A
MRYKKVLTAVKNCASQSSQSDTTATNELTAQITAITAIQQQVVTILASIKTSLSSDIRQNII